ncbi:MAG: phage tail protein [Rouxiella aceris]|uniref:phage tail protein n=1 Tax=Rouxiella aceris TaxID=2703884 RepID=UPI00283CB87C|nr:phage tail protein [Rouxiella aceris]MDR3431047.1 phage tail protein [Rouxiella aceris]
MTIKGLEQAIANMNSISSTAVPRASAQAVNRVVGRAVSRSSSTVSKETKVPRKLVMQRAKLKKATMNRPIATLKINRGNLPAIKLGAAQMRISRRQGNVRGQGSVLKIGRFTFRNAFIQQLANGRWQVLQRSGKSRYPIDVVKIPLTTPLTEAYTAETNRLMQSDMPKEMASALKNQLRLIIKR